MSCICGANGFTFEGTFRPAVVYKSRSRDTAWFSITNSKWPTLQTAMQSWLPPGNFEPNGKQRTSLADIRQSLVSEITA